MKRRIGKLTRSVLFLKDNAPAHTFQIAMAGATEYSFGDLPHPPHFFRFSPTLAFRKHAYSNTLKILPPKNGNFSDKKILIFFHISAQIIDCGYSLEPPRRGGFNEYPQSMFLSRNEKNNIHPCKPQFYYIKVGFKGVKIIKVCFRDGLLSVSKSEN